MKVAPDAPKRPALRYYGGKHNLAEWIIGHFPEHKNYVEPCCGACSVLLQKPRSPLETVNDLDGNVVNFFRVLRDRPEELIAKLRLTPWARAEYELALLPAADELEAARRFFCAIWLSVEGSSGVAAGKVKSGFRCQSEYQAHDLRLYYADIAAIVDRLQGVQIEQRDALNIIERFDGPEALIYFDPPYVDHTRNHEKVYLHEWTEADHIEAASLLRQCQGFVVISGYACLLYAELYESYGWSRVDREAQTNSGGKRIESLWLSPRTVEALALPAQAALF